MGFLSERENSAANPGGGRGGEYLSRHTKSGAPVLSGRS